MSQNLAVAILRYKRDHLPFRCYRVAVMNADDLEYVMNPKNPNREKFLFRTFDGIESLTDGEADIRAEFLRSTLSAEHGIHRIMGYELEYWYNIVRDAQQQIDNEKVQPNDEDRALHPS